MKKRILAFLTACTMVMGAMTLTACGGDEEKEETPSASASAVQEETADAPASADKEEASTTATLQGLSYAVQASWPQDTHVYEQSTTNSYDTGNGTIVVNAVPMDEAGAEFAGQLETATEEENQQIGLVPIDIPGAVSAWEIAPATVGEEAASMTTAVTIFSKSWIYTVSYTTDDPDSKQSQKEWETLLDSLSVTPENEDTVEIAPSPTDAAVIGEEASAEAPEEEAPAEPAEDAAAEGAEAPADEAAAEESAAEDTMEDTPAEAPAE